MSTIEKAAAIGGGVIGAGWVARLLLNGIDVSIYDPDPEASRKVGEVMKGARRAYRQMLPGGLPKEGKLTFAKTIAEAVQDADFIQESVPERLDLKHKVLAEIDLHAPANAIVGSSTSGILPSDMQTAMKKHPERLVVGHPFNPVYLLPLVEIVGGKQTFPEAIEVAKEIYASIGMKPVVIRKEIEAFVGDRLLEAAWREALWLIKDGICTVEELDDIMRYGFGIRWAQMGMFQVYRVAGGEAGMRHFMAQFGPALKWPWTKLMDVPEFNDELVDLIAGQSDEQAHGLSIRELEKIRDDNLVAIMEALSKQNKGKGWGAGALHNDYTKQLARLAAKKPKTSKSAEKAKATKAARRQSRQESRSWPKPADAKDHEKERQEEGLSAMDFGLSEEQRLIVETTRAFVENELYPHELEVERTGVLRPDLIAELKAKAIEAGLYAANMPADVGGAGLDTVTWLLYEKELGKANYALHWTCVARPSNILLAGTPEQREKYLFPCIRGEKSDCLAMTEPGAGSDLRGMKASAVQDGDDWILNGTKHFISHADIADFAIVLHGFRRRGIVARKTEENNRLLRRQGHARALPCATATATFRIAATPIRSWNSTTAGCRRSKSSARSTRASRSPIRGSARPGCRLAPLASAAPNARWPIPSNMPRNASNSASRSANSRACRSSSPTWRPN